MTTVDIKMDEIDPSQHMTKPSLPSDARGASRLAIDLTLLVTEIVETMHHSIARVPGPLGRPTFEPTRGVTSFAELPDAAKRYVARLEEISGVPAAIISTGSERDHTIIRDDSVAAAWFK